MRLDNSLFKVESPAPRHAWESVAGSGQDLMASQSLAWRDAVFANGTYKDLSLLYEFSSGQRILVPMARRRVRTPVEPVAASWPRHWIYPGGPISLGGPVTPDQASAILKHVARLDTFGAEIHLSHISDPVWLHEAHNLGFRVRQEPTYVLDLAGGFDEVWENRFRSNVRTGVRKAERSGIDVEIDRSGRYFGVYYDFYIQSVERWSGTMHVPLWFAKWHVTRATPRSTLDIVAERFGENCTTWVARSKGEPVAAIIVLQAGPYAMYWKGAMDKALASPLRANHLLHKLAIEQACRDGCQFYDMGRADPGGSLAGFKEKLGATLHSTHLVQAERLPVQKTMDFSKNSARKAIAFRKKFSR